MIRLSVPEIEGGPLSVTEKKDWSWSILGSGYTNETIARTHDKNPKKDIR